jgi:hypothetical protein
MMAGWWRDGVPSAGLFTGAVAWLISTQLNYALVPWVCATGMSWVVPVCSAMLMAVSLAGGWVSWRAWGGADVASADESAIAHPRRFLAGIGILSAVLFALVIATQGSAGFVLQGCER